MWPPTVFSTQRVSFPNESKNTSPFDYLVRTSVCTCVKPRATFYIHPHSQQQLINSSVDCVALQRQRKFNGHVSGTWNLKRQYVGLAHFIWKEENNPATPLFIVKSGTCSEQHCSALCSAQFELFVSIINDSDMFVNSYR